MIEALYQIDNKETLFAQMQQGATVITPNNRLSQQLLQLYVQWTTADVTEKPECFPYQAFLQQLYQRLRHNHAHQSHPILLSPHQQMHLWRHVLQSDEGDVVPDGLLSEIQSAWTRSKLWQIDMMHAAFYDNPQTLQFKKWQQDFEQQLDQCTAITHEQILDYLLLHPEVFSLKSVIWICFDDFTPQQQRLQQAFMAAGCQQAIYDLPPRESTVLQYQAQDQQVEYQQLLHWLKCRLQAGDKNIAVVVPDLANQSRTLKRLLHRHLEQEEFNVSLGESLSSYPLVQHALAWLHLNQDEISNETARLLLHSPYLAGSKSEFISRAQALQDCPLLLEEVIPLKGFKKALLPSAPKLAEIIESLNRYPSRATPAEWVKAFKARLQCFGFPGDYVLNSSNYQILQRFLTLLDEFLPLTLIHPIMDKNQALSALNDLAKSTIFQIRQPATPIKILGLLEASGSTFDSIWMTGLTDQCLPEKTRLSAFIPLSLQREHQMPHALAEREVQLARQILKRLQYGSELCIFSYPRLVGDTPHLPSPLIADLPHYTACEIKNRWQTALITREETYQIPMTPDEAISGGTALLANQAKCPFRAFATHRLRALRSPCISTGPDASERGQILHQVLDKIWHELGSQKALLRLSGEQLEQCIQNAITATLGPYAHKRPVSFNPVVQSVELSRLKRLIAAYLDWERQRPDFTVESTEQAFTINLAEIDFRVRVDRIDHSNGKKWVIDYKSRLPTQKPWHEDRPEEPQLLLYALLDENINTLLFLQLKTGAFSCSGFSEETLAVKGINALKENEKWRDYQQHWRKQLSALAEEFRHGHCVVQPSRNSICQQCDLQNLCRIRT